MAVPLQQTYVPNGSKVTVRKSWKRTSRQVTPTAFSGNRQRPLRPEKETVAVLSLNFRIVSFEELDE
jgi:hypothetical protein